MATISTPRIMMTLVVVVDRTESKIQQRAEIGIVGGDTRKQSILNYVAQSCKILEM